MLLFVRLVASLALACLLFTACEYPCGQGSLSLALVSFTDAESDTVILRRYARGSGFAALQDTFALQRSNSHFQRQGDTLLLLHGMPDGLHDITADYDFEVYLPRVGRRYRITEVEEVKLTGKKYGLKIYCVNPITSYRLDGERHAVADPYYIFLKK